MRVIQKIFGVRMKDWGCGQNPGHFDTVKDYGVTLFQRAGSCRTHVV